MPTSNQLRTENPNVVDVETSQKYYVSREIKLKELSVLGPSTYVHDYPEKPLPARAEKEAPELKDLGGRTGTTTYGDDFAKKKPSKAKSAKPGAKSAVGDVPLNAKTTHQVDFVPWPLQAPAPEDDGGEGPESIPFEHTSTYRADYPAKKAGRGPNFAPAHAVFPGVPLPDETTNRADYTKKSGKVRDPINPPAKLTPVRPFDGTTEMKAQYVGHKLGLKRVSLGVELVNDVMYTLIPRTRPLPTEAKGLFTTVHDNETTVCILVWGGEESQASKNTLLAQFDLINIPPRPKDVPNIEVTFKLDEHNALFVEARDLDHEMHAEWLAHGGEIVYRVPSSSKKSGAPQKLKAGGPNTRK